MHVSKAGIGPVDLYLHRYRLTLDATLARTMKTALRTSLLAVAAAFAAPALAADAVTDALQAAYAPYRAALFRTNGSSRAEAEQALAQARQAWKDVGDRFGAQPPAPYDRDREFGATLAQVAKVYDQAAAEIGAGRLPEAHQTLEQARELMAALRERNGVLVYSDHMNAYHAAMEHLLAEAPQQLATPQGLPALTAQVGVLDYLARQLRAKAPAALRQDAEFDALLGTVEASVRAVRQAALSQDTAALKEALGKLKPGYSRLFLRFG